jgi:ribonuclease J
MTADKNELGDNELVFLPLGGAGEIGMNLNLYGYGPKGNKRWIMVDLGITFNNGSIPGLDVIMPDPTFIEDRRDRLDGIILTHAHEDHIGAVPYLWEELGVPMYATPFTATALRHKLREAGLLKAAEIIEVPLKGSFSVGPFDLELITLTHSIPEPNAIAIRTPAGTVLHTGDWKFDPDPVIGEVTDHDALNALGDDGVLAIVCDSTNVLEEGTSGSEGDLLESITEIVSKCENRVAVSCFSSNVARIETIARAAQANGRSVVLSGRSLQRMVQSAKENGYLKGLPEFLTEDDAAHIPRENLLIICTGSQGENRASLYRMAFEEHPRMKLVAGDTVILSSRVIPGNEPGIAFMHNQLVRRGINVLTAKDHFVHVSGHPCKGEMLHMYQSIRPEISIPVHGEYRHLQAHAELARTCQVKTAIVGENGTMTRIAPGPAEIIDHVPVGRLAYDGDRLVRVEDEYVRRRTRSLYNGSVVVTVVVDKDGQVKGEPQITTTGLLVDGEDDDLFEDARDAVFAGVAKLKAQARKHDAEIKEGVRVSVRRVFRQVNKRPVTDIHVVRI